MVKLSLQPSSDAVPTNKKLKSWDQSIGNMTSRATISNSIRLKNGKDDDSKKSSSIQASKDLEARSGLGLIGQYSDSDDSPSAD